ncbi:MAG: precorrin-6y C5,15-methyltransferase (decarboxylating) subunit CbiE [Dehalococcoidia bacterium]
MLNNKVRIIGIGDSGAYSLPPKTRKIVKLADIVVGGQRLLDMFPSLTGEKIPLGNNLAEVTETIKANAGKKRVVVLASGDPNFYGIARYLVNKLGKDAVEIIPNVTSMQLAFARIKESWDEAVFTSVHARPIEDIVDVVRSNYKIGIFTDDKNTPAAIAQVLLAHGIDGYQSYVCEDLGGEQENIISTDLHSLSKMDCSPLNILILLRVQQGESDQSSRSLLGIPDEEFHKRSNQEGLITKQEVRAIALAKMHLSEDSIVWDIGAGSGAVSVEASFLCKRGRIFSVEKNPDDIAVLEKNLRKFRVANVKAVQSLAPDCLAELPAPDAVFIGGSSGKMEAILDTVCQRLKPGGRVVINAATLENLNAALGSFQEKGFTTETTLVNIAHGKAIADLTRLQALNPVFIVAAGKGRAGKDDCRDNGPDDD